jgi:hypothetical protein
VAVKLFFCYAHEDELLLNILKNHLSPLHRLGLIDMWHDRDISAGTKWEEEIDKHLNEADIILLLVSPDFMNSEYCYGKEMQRALERDKRGEARVIPVILRPVYWQSILGHLQALPTDAKPVMSAQWYNVDEALFDVAEGIRKAVEDVEGDSLIADYYVAQSVREQSNAAEALKSSNTSAESSDYEKTGTSRDKQEQASLISQPSELEDDSEVDPLVADFYVARSIHEAKLHNKSNSSAESSNYEKTGTSRDKQEQASQTLQSSNKEDDLFANFGEVVYHPSTNQTTPPLKKRVDQSSYFWTPQGVQRPRRGTVKNPHDKPLKPLMQVQQRQVQLTPTKKRTQNNNSYFLIAKIEQSIGWNWFGVFLISLILLILGLQIPSSLMWIKYILIGFSLLAMLIIIVKVGFQFTRN